MGKQYRSVWSDALVIPIGLRHKLGLFTAHFIDDMIVPIFICDHVTVIGWSVYSIAP